MGQPYAKFHNYDRFPQANIAGFDDEAWAGYPAIATELAQRAADRRRTVIVLDFYPGVDREEVLRGLMPLQPSAVFDVETCMLPADLYAERIAENLTDDRVFGVMTTHRLSDYFVSERIDAMRAEIDAVQDGIILVCGTGAALVTAGDLLVYCDLARWEIQCRYKKGMPNFHASNTNEPQLTKYKRGFFVDWRLADRHKKKLFDRIDYLLDTNVKDCPKMVTGEAFTAGLRQVSVRPFRVVPYFDPGVWGGQWMKDVCGLPKDAPNYAWSFDGVPEENSLYLRYGEVRVEVPSVDLVFYRPHQLLGERVHGRFGDEFPIRFDFLDTMGGGNLSLQVHPLTEYIQQTFGMHYTQDESYYLLDCAEDDTYVYLGLCEGVEPDEMLADLRRAQAGEEAFDAEKYVNKIPVKKHDHVLIPAGTIHCSGKNTMVLEISATPYIFTFKLWDWGRLGLDGLPRPIHIEHGEQVIQWDRTTKWVYDNLVGQTKTLSEQPGIREEWTGLHEREFIETHRHTFTEPVRHSTEGSVNVLNLVEGEEAEVVSVDGSFEPFVVHYAETFIIPAAVETYLIRPTAKSAGQTLMTIKAYVR